MGCTFADYDSDGDIDIYLTAVGDNKLLRNDQSKFTDVTARDGQTYVVKESRPGLLSTKVSQKYQTESALDK